MTSSGSDHVVMMEDKEDLSSSQALTMQLLLLFGFHGVQQQEQQQQQQRQQRQQRQQQQQQQYCKTIQLSSSPPIDPQLGRKKRRRLETITASTIDVNVDWAPNVNHSAHCWSCSVDDVHDDDDDETTTTFPIIKQRRETLMSMKLMKHRNKTIVRTFWWSFYWYCMMLFFYSSSFDDNNNNINNNHEGRWWLLMMANAQQLQSNNTCQLMIMIPFQDSYVPVSSISFCMFVFPFPIMDEILFLCSIVTIHIFIFFTLSHK
jgi:type II secretory pathway pseudopilin PulG